MSRSLSGSQRIDFSSSVSDSQQVNNGSSRMIGSLRSNQSSYSSGMIETNDDEEDDISTGLRTNKAKPKLFNLDDSENERDKVSDFIHKISFGLQSLFHFEGCRSLGT